MADKPGSIRAGLMKGRINPNHREPPSPIVPAFADALEAATKNDLAWALSLLISHPRVRRTYRNYRMEQIAKRLMEIGDGD